MKQPDERRYVASIILSRQMDRHAAADLSVHADGIGVTRYRLARGAMRAAHTAGSPEEPYPSTSAGPICALHMKRKL